MCKQATKTVGKYMLQTRVNIFLSERRWTSGPNLTEWKDVWQVATCKHLIRLFLVYLFLFPLNLNHKNEIAG